MLEFCTYMQIFRYARICYIYADMLEHGTDMQICESIVHICRYAREYVTDMMLHSSIPPPLSQLPGSIRAMHDVGHIII